MNNRRGMNKSLKYGMIILTAFCGLLLRSTYERTQIKQRLYEIRSKKIESNKVFRFVMLADLHSKVYGNNNEPLIRMIGKEKPDGIFIAGDMIIGKPNEDCKISLSLMEELVKVAPIYYGNGNHEQRMKEYVIYKEGNCQNKYQWYREELMKLGVTVLDNESLDIIVKGENFRITGLELPYKYFEKFTYQIAPVSLLNEEVGPCRNHAYEILIAHNPAHMKSYSEWGADLVLSGHVHGGFAQIPFFGGIITPQVKLFPKYSGGKYFIGKCIGIVSRGLGEHTMPLRLLNKPELSIIELKGTK